MEQKTSAAAPRENILGTERIGRLLAIFAIPGIVSMVVNSIYNIVDQIFIGQGVGYLGNGATNVIFPMTTPHNSPRSLSTAPPLLPGLITASHRNTRGLITVSPSAPKT